MNTDYHQADIVIFDYSEITDKKADLSERIEKAYGLHGLGVCVVKNIPDFVDAREKLLPLAQKLGTLPDKELDQITFPEINFSRGWSHGKEKFMGVSDFSKGSFYAVASKEENTPVYKKDNDIDKLNIWPKSIPDLKDNFQNLGQIMIDTGIELSFHIDKYCEMKNENYEKGKLVRIIKESDSNTGRLLHYFPQEKEKEQTPWCGIHNDHGSLTALCGAMYLDREGKIVDFKDSESGFFIFARDGKEYKAAIPKDALAFQIGETHQIHSGGVLRATPHYVKAGNKIVSTGISRNTLAVFMEPREDEMMDIPKGKGIDDVCGYEIDSLPRMADRFKEGITFGEFAHNTLKAFDASLKK